LSPRCIPRQIFWLIVITLLAHVAMTGGRIGASLYALRLGHSQWLAGLAYGLYNLLPGLLSLHLGRWVDRAGPRRVMGVGLGAMVLGLLGPVLVPGLPAVLLSSGLCGFGFGSCMLAANLAVARLPYGGPQAAASQQPPPRPHDRERTGMLGWLQLGNSVSAVVSPAAVGLALDHGGFRAAFAGLALAACAGLAALAGARLPSAPAGGKRSGGQGVLHRAVTDPGLRRMYLLAMAVSLAWDGFVFMVPVLGEAGHLSASVIGGVLSAFAAGTFVVRLALPWLLRGLGGWQLLSLAFALAAAVFLALPWARQAAVLALLGFVFGLAAGGGQPLVLNLIYGHLPAGQAGEGAGLRAMLANLAGFGGSLVFGLIAATSGPATVFAGMAGLMVLAGWQSVRGGAGH